MNKRYIGKQTGDMVIGVMILDVIAMGDIP